MNENISYSRNIFQTDMKMFSFNFMQILGLLLFFFGLIILNRCQAMERMDHLTRSLPETTDAFSSDLRQGEITRQLVRKSFFYSSVGIAVSLGGMAMFFVSAV